MRIAILQMNSGIDPAANARVICDAIADAAANGAAILFTPEMCGLLDRDRKRAAQNIVAEGDDRVLQAACNAAAKHGIFIALGSLAIRRDDGRWANRSFLIDAAGQIISRYDKIHMFDVNLANGESWNESAAYAAGSNIVVAPDTPVGQLGLAICYDMRFPALFDALGREKCDAIAIPAAFTVPTGRDHWHILLQARAIEASAFVIAAAQVGEHEDGRHTFGHSLVIDPWGKILLDMGADGPGLGYADLDLAHIAEVRSQLPSLANRKEIAK